MAFRFFRRRQKMVILIMVALMVAFLIGFQGFQALLGPGRRQTVLGSSRLGNLTAKERKTAEADLEILGTLGLGRSEAVGAQEFRLLLANGQREGVAAGETVLAYALLRKEAAEANIAVSQSDVDQLFRQLGYEPDTAEYDAKMTDFHQRGLSSGNVRSAMARWLAVVRLSRAARPNVPPAAAELRRHFAHLAERIRLRGARWTAGQFLADVREPAQAELTQHYNLYREALPARLRSGDDLGFGYAHHDEVRIAYLLIRREPLERGVYVSWDEATKEADADLGAQAPSGPDAAAGDDDEAPGANGTAEADADAAGPETPDAVAAITAARQRKAAERAGRILQSLTVSARRLAQTHQKNGVEPLAAYQRVRDAFLDRAGAQALLARPIQLPKPPRDQAQPAEHAPPPEEPDRYIVKKQRLDDTIRRLSDLTGVGICFPWGQVGLRNIPPDLEITLRAEEGLTLGEALRRVREQIKSAPAIQWAVCRPPAGGSEHLANILFPVGQMSLFPLAPRQTPYLDRQQLQPDTRGDNGSLALASTHRLLQRCYGNRRGEGPLRDLAFRAASLTGEDGGVVEVGKQAPAEMYVLAPVGLAAPGRSRAVEGVVLWTLTAARPRGAAPEAKTYADIPTQFRARVQRDWRIARALQKAVEFVGRDEQDGPAEGTVLAVAREKGLLAAAAQAQPQPARRPTEEQQKEEQDETDEDHKETNEEQNEAGEEQDKANEGQDRAGEKQNEADQGQDGPGEEQNEADQGPGEADEGQNEADEPQKEADKEPDQADDETEEPATFDTGLFARLGLQARLDRSTGRVYFRAGPAGVPEVELASDAARQRFLQAAFSLAPEDVEPADGPEPYPVQPYAVTSITLPRTRQVLLLQREDYRPAGRAAYEDGTGLVHQLRAAPEVRGWLGEVLQQQGITTGRELAYVLIQQERQTTAVQRWFRLEDIEKRLKYKPAGPS